MKRCLLLIALLLVAPVHAARYLCASADVTNVMRESTKSVPTVYAYSLDIGKDTLRISDGKTASTFVVVFDGRDLTRRSVVIAYEVVGQVGTITSLVFNDADKSLVRTVTNSFGASVLHATCRDDT